MANNHDHQHHVIPLKVYMYVAGALFALTFLTVIAYQFRMYMGPLAAPVAFLIAAVKASLVMGFFMHLKYDNLMNRVIFGTAFFFLALLFAFSAMDVFTRVLEKSTL